jgi:hypothetical protein
MDQASWTVCQALLQNCPSEKKRFLVRFLPKNQRIAAETATLLELKDIPAAPEKELDKVHYTWLTPFLRMLPENEIRLYLSALTEDQSKELQKALLFSNHLVALAPVAKEYLQKNLWKKIGGSSQLPLACLLHTPLNALLRLSGAELQKLSFLLGLHDLAHEMRQIIETAKLKKIQAALSKEEQLFLKMLIQKKEQVVFKQLALAKWDGNEELLRKIVLGRGTNRLAKGLYGHDASLIWHIAHRIDMETGSMLIKLSTALELPRAHEVLIEQIQEALSTLHSKTLGGT